MSRSRARPSGGQSGRGRVTVGAVVGLIVALIGAIAGGNTGACSRSLGVDTASTPSSGGSTASGSASSSKSSSPRSGSAKSPPSRTQTEPAKSVHLELGTPVPTSGKDAPDDTILIKPQYALSYSGSKNIANWVSWNLNASYFGDVPRHKGKFITDSSLPGPFYHVTHDDYSGSGYDRGHMVRSEERTATADDNKATFLLTNILPQYHDLNAGPWLRLEEYAQTLAQKGGRELYVMAGGVLSARPSTIGKGVAVPDSFFKIIVVLEHGQRAADVGEKTRVIAVIMPNTQGIITEDWGRYRTTVDEIEKRSGYDFLTRVPPAVQDVIERATDSGPTN